MSGLAGCGSYAGYQAHRRREEEACADCREANRVYLAAWRDRNRAAQALLTAKQGARDKAMRRLAEQFPAAFAALYAEELSALAERGAECA